MYTLQLLISGMASGGIYALVGLGFAVIFKASGIFNFAQGEFLMLSGLVAYRFCVAGADPTMALALSLLFAAGIGLATYYLVCRRLYGKPLFNTIIATLGLSIILKGLAGLVFGHEPRKFPRILPSFELGEGLVLGGDHIAILLALALVVGPIFWFFRFHREGLAMRTTAIDPLTTLMMGVNPDRTQALAWMLAGLFGGLGGALLGSITFVAIDSGNVGLRALPAVLLGGLDSPIGVIIGGLLIGITETLFLGYFGHMFGGDIREVFAYVVLLIAMFFIPAGLLGTRSVTRV